MEIVTHHIGVQSRDSEQLIMPVGDIQWYGEDAGVALGMLKRHIEWGVEHNALFLGMGDYVDAWSPSNRQRIRAAALYDTAQAIVDQKAEALVEEIYEKALKPSKGRWLGLLEGHHYHQFRAGMTTDMLLADKLGARFLGTSAYVRLLFSRSDKSNAPVLIWCHHGAGAGQTPAAILNKLKSMASGFAGDIFLMGHLPKKCNDSIDVLEPVFPRKGDPLLIHRTKILSGTGGFMKSWVVGSKQGIVPRGGYGEVGMYTPASLGGVVVKVRPRWKAVGGHDIWVPDMSVEA